MKAKLWQTVQHFYWTRIATRWHRANHALRGTDRFYAAYVAEAEKKGDRQVARSMFAMRGGRATAAKMRAAGFPNLVKAREALQQKLTQKRAEKTASNTRL
jgi:hypothetical protein